MKPIKTNRIKQIILSAQAWRLKRRIIEADRLRRVHLGLSAEVLGGGR